MCYSFEDMELHLALCNIYWYGFIHARACVLWSSLPQALRYVDKDKAFTGGVFES
jgi:hypothetical protein